MSKKEEVPESLAKAVREQQEKESNQERKTTARSSEVPYLQDIDQEKQKHAPRTTDVENNWFTRMLQENPKDPVPSRPLTDKESSDMDTCKLVEEISARLGTHVSYTRNPGDLMEIRQLVEKVYARVK